MLGQGFDWAIRVMKAKGIVTRLGWNGKNMYVKVQEPDKYSKMKRPYIYMKPVDGQLVPWVASQSDILENDWILYEPKHVTDCCSPQPQNNPVG